MRLVSRIVVAILLLGTVAFAYATRARWQAVPSPGSFRFRDADNGVIGGALLETPGGKVAIIEVDYQGPKEWVEVVVENWQGSALVSTETLMRTKYGSDLMEQHDWGFQSTVGPAFSHQRQVYSIWLDRLPETLPDGRNAIGKVIVGDPNESGVASNHSAIIRVLAHEDARSFTTEWWPDMPFSRASDRVASDTEKFVLWQKSAYVERGHDAGREPPYPDGVKVSRMLFRLAEK